ncbi:MAG: hypothetical protein JNN30_12770 [Rhodanobacteraceae bacterium]|nr:hypothetical protein [Rhodanobacteraceae bacterium]
MRRALCLALFFAVPVVHAADPADPTGRWRGTIAIPGAPVVTEIDLDRAAEGVWVGSLTAPEFKLRGAPLLELKVADKHIAAAVHDLASSDGKQAKFDLNLERDGRLRGSFLQAGWTAPVELQRIAAADVQLPRASTAVPAAWAGEWKGEYIGTGGYARQVTLKLSNVTGGPARAECMVVGKITTTLHVNFVSAVQDFLEIGSDEGIGIEARMDNATHRLVGSLGYGGLEFPLTLERKP